MNPKKYTFILFLLSFSWLTTCSPQNVALNSNLEPKNAFPQLTPPPKSLSRTYFNSLLIPACTGAITGMSCSMCEQHLQLDTIANFSTILLRGIIWTVFSQIRIKIIEGVCQTMNECDQAHNQVLAQASACLASWFAYLMHQRR